MSRPHVFVSFSGRDRALIRRLFARLGAQPLELWNYADEGQEIPGGEVLTHHLEERINRSDYFLPFISVNSLHSPYTQWEVRYALTRQAKNCLRIVPLLAPSCPPAATWPEPYRSLAEFRYRWVDFQSAASLEEAVITLCADMRVHYLPLPTMDPRLPFMDRFVVEIEDRCPRHEERDIAVYQHLMRVMTEFEEAFAKGDFP